MLKVEPNVDILLKHKKIIRKRTHNDMLEVIINYSDEDESDQSSHSQQNADQQ